MQMHMRSRYMIKFIITQLRILCVYNKRDQMRRSNCLHRSSSSSLCLAGGVRAGPGRRGSCDSNDQRFITLRNASYGVRCSLQCKAKNPSESQPVLCTDFYTGSVPLWCFMSKNADLGSGFLPLTL